MSEESEQNILTYELSSFALPDHINTFAVTVPQSYFILYCLQLNRFHRVIAIIVLHMPDKPEYKNQFATQYYTGHFTA